MSEEIKDAREVSPEIVPLKRKTPAFGPGYVNLAVPDRGHMGSCVAMEFGDAGAYNAYCAEHSDWLTVALMTRGDVILAIFQVLKTDLEIHEMRLVAQYTEEKMAEYRAKKQEQEATDAKLKAEQEEADDACRRIGRLCIEKHGAFVEQLPGLSKIKVTRKSIADDIVCAVEEETGKHGMGDKLIKILAKYVKEGA